MKTKSTELFEAIMQNLNDNESTAMDGMSIYAERYIEEYKEILRSSWTSQYNSIELSNSRVKKIQDKINEVCSR